ncbi:hypothetical protein LQQ57_07870 [Escherichia coli]|nr:hypothetical protein [Escherichia coli]
MSDYLKGKRVVDPVLTSIARGYKNAAFIGERIFPVVLTDKEGRACTDLRGKPPLWNMTPSVPSGRTAMFWSVKKQARWTWCWVNTIWLRRWTIASRRESMF